MSCVFFLLFTSFAIMSGGSARGESERIFDQSEMIASPGGDRGIALSENFDSLQGASRAAGNNLSARSAEQILQFLTSSMTLWDGKEMLTIDRFVDGAVLGDSGRLTIALSSHCKSPKVCQLLVPIKSLETSMPDLAVLDHEFHLQVVNGALYIAIDLTMSSTSTNLTFSSFTPAKEDRWFTFGSDASIKLLGHPMFISILSVPGDMRSEIVQPAPCNGSQPVEVNVRVDQLEILFDGSDCSGQCVSFNQYWLESFGIGTPMFLTESGEVLQSEYQYPQYVVEVPHFSAVVIREDFNSIADGFVFTQGGGSSFMSNCINARDGVQTFSPKKSIHQGYTGGSPDGTDFGVVSATKTYSLSRIGSVGLWFYVSYYYHDWNYWDYLKGGIRLNLKDSQGTIMAKYEYWLFSWRQSQDYMDPSDPAHEKRIYGKPPIGSWVKFFGCPDQDWSNIPWGSASTVAVELFVHGSGTCGDHFEVHFDDLTVSTDTSCITYVFKGATEVRQDSQSFSFEVPPSSVYVSASMSYKKLGTNPSATCDVDGSFWDAAGQRTGGYTSHDQSAKEQIPNSAYSLLTSNPEYMYVTSVSSGSTGLWTTSVFCRSTSTVGATFEIRIDIYISESLQSNCDSTRFSFSAPSNSCEIRAQLDHSQSVDFDMNLWDSIGRRTGGWMSSNYSTSYLIFNSAYSGYSANPEWVDVVPARASQEIWEMGSYSFWGNGYYHLGVVVETDSDCDGVRDSEDIDPGHDLCIRLKIDQIKELDRMDSGSAGRGDPYVRIVFGDLNPSTLGGDAWDAEIWTHTKIPLAENPSNGIYQGDYYLWKNVPDRQQTVDLQIQVWDDDAPATNPPEIGYPNGIDDWGWPDDIGDISRRTGGGDESNQDGSTLHLTYNLMTGQWSGDDCNIPGSWDSSPGYSSGEEDGYAGDQSDCTITFSIETVYDLTTATKLYLAQKHSPVMYFDTAEECYPIEVRAMLDQSNLMKNDRVTVFDTAPIAEQSLTTYRTDSYVDQLSTSQVGYANQVYAHVFVSDEDTIVIQYWFFYVYNGHSINNHEGDWEMIQLLFYSYSYDSYLDGDLETQIPEYAGYSQHYGGERKAWSDVQKDGTHPKVYVDLGGHASYYSGSQSVERTYPIALLSPNPILNYYGKWGESDWSVPGPVYRCSKLLYGLGNPIAYMWHEPKYWWDSMYKP